MGNVGRGCRPLDRCPTIRDVTRPGRDDEKDIIALGNAERGDLVEFGSGRDRAPRGWLVWLGIVVVAIVAIVVVTHHDHKPTASPSPSVSTVGTAPSSFAVPNFVALNALGATSLWQIVARGDTSLVRITPATGAVTFMAVPQLASTGPVNMIVGPNWTLIEPIDAVPAMDAKDDKTVAALNSTGGYVIAGPKPGEMWTVSEEPYIPTATLSLIEMGGRVLAEIKNVDPSAMLTSDGAGNVVAQRETGFYNLTPTSSRLITSGNLVAVGPTKWLVSECKSGRPCVATVIDRKTGARHALAAFNLRVDAEIGAIAPNGKIAAVYADGPDGTPQLNLIDLGTGLAVPVAVVLPDAISAQTIVWSPESKCLFVAGRDGKLDAVNAAGGQVAELAESSHPVLQLAIRPAP